MTETSMSSNVIPPECPMHSDVKPVAPQECPMHVDAKEPVPPLECPMHTDSKSAGPPPECPMHAGGNDAPLDPANMMPPANQQPSPDQPFSLSTERVTSNIPRGGTDGNWQYPSEQMFWNAMLRKGWRWEKDSLNPQDMSHIIRIHNANNEQAWQEVLKWESFRGTDTSNVKLLKFGGKASEYSPRARFRAALGYDLPFDRHDWIIDRNGRHVRYIIDYYDVGDEHGYKTGEFVELDVRPAFDSLDSMIQRSKAAAWRWAIGAVSWFRSTKDPPEVTS